MLVLAALLLNSRVERSALRVEYVEPDFTYKPPGVFFSDDFNAPPRDYFEFDQAKESFAWTMQVGMNSTGAMKATWSPKQVNAGNLKVLFGRNPFNKGVQTDRTFREIFWRVYVKNEPGWEGDPAKFARVTCLGGEDWSQGLFAHVWSGKNHALCIDPATGIQDDKKVTTKYNDFDHMKWLGSVDGKTPIFTPAESGRWICVECQVKLNNPGAEDGAFQLWVDGKLEAAKTKLNWHGKWEEFGINAFFLENYWNDGAPKKESRYFEELALGTRRIGPLASPPNPIIHVTDTSQEWVVQVGDDPYGESAVWTSRPMPVGADSVAVHSKMGKFEPSKAIKLEPGAYWVRVRRNSQSQWSPWHSPFVVK